MFPSKSDFNDIVALHKGNKFSIWLTDINMPSASKEM